MNLVEETVELLKELVANACVNDSNPTSGNEWRSADTLERYFADTCLTVTRIEPAPGRTTLIAHLPGSDPTADPLTLIGHTDVVPVDQSRWSHPPFEVSSDGEKLWGRGVVDMLHLTAAMAVIIKAAATGNTTFRGALTFVAAADEEARAGLGMRWIEEHAPHAIDWRYCISESGGGHIHGARGSDAIVITVGEKGAAQRRLHVTGDAGHGSVPLGKHSAVDIAAQVVQRLGNAIVPRAADDLWATFVEAFEFDQATETSLIGGTYDGDYTCFGDLAPYAHAISRMSIARTAIHAGTAINVLPSYAQIDLDIRTLPGMDDDDVDAVLRHALADFHDKVAIERLICEEATLSPQDNRLYDVIATVLSEQHPTSRVIPVLFPGGTDLRVARRQGGVGYGFGSCAQPRTLGSIYGQLHAHDECLFLEDLELTVMALHEVVRRFLQ
ncbi:M20/M25/M40 family metallo-hydrolase [Schaalia suimastitidis]|uniref:M20/M25/M40 family metallo-hydrolase n=1 Tax=Schaalia suimastitidis TaxID=121163 RepID=UPI00040A9EE4|nr:M20/M25/M40 family metallo-hydrolase [Schaalia suimastitidis]